LPLRSSFLLKCANYECLNLGVQSSLLGFALFARRFICAFCAFSWLLFVLCLRRFFLLVRVVTLSRRDH